MIEMRIYAWAEGAGAHANFTGETCWIEAHGEGGESVATLFLYPKLAAEIRDKLDEYVQAHTPPSPEPAAKEPESTGQLGTPVACPVCGGHPVAKLDCLTCSTQEILYR